MFGIPNLLGSLIACHSTMQPTIMRAFCLCQCPHCSISRVVFQCILFSLTSLVVSEDGHSRMRGSDVAAIWQVRLSYNLDRCMLLSFWMYIGCSGIFNNAVTVGPLCTFFRVLGQCSPVDLRRYCLHFVIFYSSVSLAPILGRGCQQAPQHWKSP